MMMMMMMMMMMIIIIIIIIIISCYPLWDTGCQQNVAILSYLWPSSSPRSSSSLFLMPHCVPN
jgi:hypothetical protein